MRKLLFVFGLAFGLLMLNIGLGDESQSESVQSYEIDPAHTKIGFSARHMVLTEVSGKFQDYQVDLNWDAENPENSSFEAYIDAASIDTDNEKRDKHLKSEDFLHVEEYPEIVFKSSDIQKTDDGYVANGNLTIRDVTKEVSLPFEVLGQFVQPDGKTRIGFEASLTINRFDYNVDWDKEFGIGELVVGEDIEINIQSEFVSAEPS